MNTYSFGLDLHKDGYGAIVTMRRGDKLGTTITATLYDDGIPLTGTGFSAYLVMRLPDGSAYRQPATYSSGVVTHTVTELTAEGFTAIAYFELQKDGVIRSTEPFDVIILPSA